MFEDIVGSSEPLRKVLRQVKVAAPDSTVLILGEKGAIFNDLPHFAGGIVPGDGIFTKVLFENHLILEHRHELN